MKKMILIFSLVLGLSLIWAQVPIFNECVPTFTQLPTDWTSNNGGGNPVMQTATSGYLLVDHQDDWVITKAYDLSLFENIELFVKVATYGNGAFNNPLTIEVSNDDGATWTYQSFVTDTPTSSTYVSSGPYAVTSSATQVKFRFRRDDAAGKGVRFREILLQGDPLVDIPLITVNPEALTGFNYVIDNGPSEEQSFIVTGTDLDENISVTASADYEISTGTGSSFSATSPITLTQNGGNVSEVTIYVRLKAGLSVGDYINEEITATSAGAGDKTVICTGEVTAPPPPEAPVATAATDIDDVSFIANWEAVNDVTGYYLDVYTKTAGTNATDLFISEYIEGASFNKAIEIYNGTGIAVDLSTYSLKKQTNGAGDFKNELVLSGILEPSDVYITAHSRANATILALANDDNEGLTNFNGNDAVALYKDGVMIDVVGFADQVAMWGENITLVRKNTITSPTIAYNIDDWDQYPEDTMEYLGSHTMAGASSNAFVTGYNNFDVGNVTSYAVTGLAPETTYYYVVRAYKDYQTHMLASVNSNEISVTTEATEDSQVVVNGEGDDTVTGATLIVGGAIPDDLLGPDTGIPAVIYTITSSGIKDVLVNRHSSFGNVDWYCWLITPSGQMYGADSIDAGNNSQLFRGIDFGDNGDVIVIMNDNPTLPVELSSFTVAMNAYNNAVLTWVTQTETSVNGFHIYRNMEDDLENAELISNLIPATNTSQQQVYVYSDKELNSTGTYYYWLQVSDLNGSDSFHGPITLVYEEGNDQQIPIIPEITELKKVFPNPFNPSATISYGLVDAAPVSIRIYNSRGQMVRSFEEGMKNAGSYNLTWNGDDDRGRSLSTGVYYIRMQAGNQTFNKKVVLMK